jgi:hypothetical protein
MKAYKVIFIALLLVLAACSKAPSPAATPEEETLTSQGVLPGASGLVYYINYNPLVVKRYSVVSYDQATGTKKTLYSDSREMQSVAGTPDGFRVIISMRATSTSGFEIFKINNTLPPEALRLTSNLNNTNVSITRAGTMVWETVVSCGAFCFRHVIQVRDPLVLPASQNKFVDGGSGDLTQPTISGNGDYIAFVRVSGNMQRVELYNRITHSFSVIASNSIAPSSITFSAPSPSDDGTKVAYLRKSNVFPNPAYSSIRLYNNGVTSSIVNGVPFSHPHLTADGKWLIYAKEVNNTFRIKTRNLLTNLETDATTPSSPVSHFAPFWQKANP